jgi:quercetin dioxygenase-like cupin family protein
MMMLKMYKNYQWLSLVTTLLTGLALSAPVVKAQVPGACAKPVSERTGEFGCYVDTNEVLSELPKAPMFWHLYNFPTRAAAQALKIPNSTVVESFSKVWLYMIAEESWKPSGGERVAVIGPLPIAADKQYTARYMQAVFKPGMQAHPHHHSGPEAFYLVSGSQCLETPDGITVSHAGESAIVPQGDLMTVQSAGTQTRRALVLVLHDTSQPWQTLTTEWKPKGLCPK